MPLTIQQQYDTGINAITTGDMDLFQKLVLDPDTVTIPEQRSVAQKLGIKGGLFSAMVNTFSDPTVWLAMLMSRRFPTQSFIRGTIPHRFIGTANEFTGISRVARPVEVFFRGTTVSKLVPLKQYREQKVMETARKWFDITESRGLAWKEEMPIVSQLMEGQPAHGATPELRRVAGELRGVMSEMWRFLGKTKKVSGGFEGSQITRASAQDFTLAEAPRYIRDYLPHIPLVGKESVLELSGIGALKRISRNQAVAQALAAKGEKLQDVWSIDASDRLSSEFSRYQAHMNNIGAQIYNPRLFRRQRHNLALQSVQGQELFITDLNIMFHKYASAVSRTYAINAPLSEWERTLATVTVKDATGRLVNKRPSSDPIIVQVINEGLDSTGAKFVRRPVAGTNKFSEFMVPGSENATARTALTHLVRALKGTQSEDEIIWGNLYSSVASKLDQWARRTGVSKKVVTQTDEALKSLQRTRSYRNGSNGIASYFYGTTLGLNPWSAIQNLLQPVLTTAPAIGIGPTIAGMGVLKSRLPVYARQVIAEHRALRGRGTGRLHSLSTAAERAFEKTFPELAQQGIKIDPRLFDIDERALVEAVPGVRGSKMRTLDDWNKFILQPFTHAELSNRVTTFFGAKRALKNAIKTGEYRLPREAVSPSQIDDILNFEAGQLVTATQFQPTPGSRSIWQNSLPAPFRQFTSFQTRLANFFTESTVRGAMTNRQIEETSVMNFFAGGAKGAAAQQKVLSFGTGRNMGTLARTFLYAKVMTNSVREALGVDLGNALGVVSPFNVAPAGQILAPLPLPPGPSVVVGLMQAATTRDAKRLQGLELPVFGKIPIPKTLFPAGVALTRMARAVNQWRPDMGGRVDDNERLMYRGTTTDVILSAIGIPLDKNRRVRDVMERVQANRQAIRRRRREFASALRSADVGRIKKLRAEWAQKFPDLPPLGMSHKDRRRHDLNARLPMVQRMIRTLGRSGRYLEDDIYEHDPDMLAPR